MSASIHFKRKHELSVRQHKPILDALARCLCLVKPMCSTLKHTPNLSVVVLKRILDGFIITILLMISATMYYQPSRLFPRRQKISNEDEKMNFSSYWQFLSSDFDDEGFHFPHAASTGRERFVTYEPPVGGWSKQLLAFENAVVVAKLLNRTLLAHPLISETEAKRLRRVRIENERHGTQVSLEVEPKFTVPLSAVINIRQLSKIITVRLIRTSYAAFLEKFANFTFYDICHQDTIGFWLDFIPSPTSTKAWRVLEAQHYDRVLRPIVELDPGCDQELEMTGLQEKSTPIFRAFVTELADVEADIISFKGGSLATHELRFLSKHRAAMAQSWLLSYIQFSLYTRERVQRIVRSIKKPYNVIIITNNSDSLTLNNILHFRLKEMEKRNFRQVTNRLYVVTNLEDFSVLRPLELTGYELYSANKLIPSGLSPHIRNDVIKLLESLICKYARLFVGPLDSHLLQRARIHEAKRKDGLLTEHINVRWAMHTMRKKFRILSNNVSKDEKRKNSSAMTTNLRAMVCGMCKQMRTNKNACKVFKEHCVKQR